MQKSKGFRLKPINLTMNEERWRSKVFFLSYFIISWSILKMNICTYNFLKTF